MITIILEIDNHFLKKKKVTQKVLFSNVVFFRGKKF